MTWLDFFAILLFGGLLSLAYNRGIVLEVTELIALLTAGFMGFRLFRPIAGFLHSVLFKGWSLLFLQRSSFFLVFILVFLGVFSIGLTIERRMKEEKQIEKLTDKRMGLAFGFFKGAWMMCLILGMMFYLQLVPAREAPKLKSGPFVSAFLGLRSFVTPTIYLMAPSDLAKDFIKVGLTRSGKSRK
jgi:uncharacterized membrane protein required for colicin V production